MQLPDEFIRRTRALMGDERFEQYLRSFDEEPPVSIRLNPLKTQGWQPAGSSEPVPWCTGGYYLSSRPQFTFDPLFHAGCYYVQEAASMFLDEVLRQTLSIVNCQLSIDMCAAPGGKSTLLRSALPQGCVLYSNEPIRQRASILLENVQKWGYADHLVTNLYPRDYRKSKMKFDLILCDVPCSGEGMFRKDGATIREWSPQNVEKCWMLQRDIVSDAWQCLNDGGILIYSTCTFNTKENEENIRWMLSELDARVLPVETRPEWHITGSLLPGFSELVYRFIPGISRSEGLFMCVLRKGKKTLPHPLPVREGSRYSTKSQPIRLMAPLPHREGSGESLPFPLTYSQALAYLRHEALALPPDTPRGLVEVCFEGIPLGLAKNIGTRANNLYPKEWRIKSTHTPQDYTPVLEPKVND
ncbi:MAG: hypothetical protein IJ588_11330 [Prevotella sp.]|nr:hypothetical protein [Prevotella sp.]